jgi:hypothetical protein
MSRQPLEWAAIRAARSLIVLLPASIPLLLVRDLRDEWLLPVVLIQLGIVVLAGLWVAVALTARLDEPWYQAASPWAERMGAAATVVVLATGAVALTTLGSSAAMRYEPSLQFLQLLSALDIAWVTAAIAIGVTWLRGRRYGVAAGLMMAAICVWSIWTYLDAVGFGPGGSWKVDGAALLRYVLPYDVASAVMAITAVVLGARKQIRGRQDRSAIDAL